jgi:methylmalonyl-CoA mutase N-terminal domain/subunit
VRAVATSESGLPVQPVYGPGALDGFDTDVLLGEPGGFPFTRGVYPSMYTADQETMERA